MGKGTTNADAQQFPFIRGSAVLIRDELCFRCSRVGGATKARLIARPAERRLGGRKPRRLVCCCTDHDAYARIAERRSDAERGPVIRRARCVLPVDRPPSWLARHNHFSDDLARPQVGVEVSSYERRDWDAALALRSDDLQLRA